MLAELSGVVWIRSWAGRLVIVWLGLFFVAVGNLLPRTRPNLVVGIRTRRTLADRQFWIRLHRLSGYAAVVVGCVIVVSGAFLRRPIAFCVTRPSALQFVTTFAQGTTLSKDNPTCPATQKKTQCPPPTRLPLH